MTFLTFRTIFLSTSLALLIGLPAAWLARRLKLLDQPAGEPHKQHALTVPLAGGLVILIIVLGVALFEGLWNQAAIRSILLPGLIVFAFGLWDDHRHLSALWKLVGQLLATVILILLGVQIRLFDTLPWLNIAITVLWVVGITNAYNFVDSMDGLATGLAALTAAFFMLVTYDSNQLDLSSLSAILVGACIGCFYYTAPPAKFFLGDSGAQLLGFLLAGLAIAYNPLGFLRIQSWYVPILLLGVPIFDMILVVYSRLRRGKPVYQAGRDHTYHRLVALGLDTNRAVLTMQFAALLLGCLAFIALAQPPLIANLIFGGCLIAGMAALLILDHRKGRL